MLLSYLSIYHLLDWSLFETAEVGRELKKYAAYTVRTKLARTTARTCAMRRTKRGNSRRRVPALILWKTHNRIGGRLEKQPNTYASNRARSYSGHGKEK